MCNQVSICVTLVWAKVYCVGIMLILNGKLQNSNVFVSSKVSKDVLSGVI